MKKALPATLLVICVSLISGFCALINHSLIKEETERGVWSLLFLRSAILMYAEDARKEGKTIIFPASLDALVEGNYLNTGDIHDFCGLKIEVLQPGGKGLSTDIILRGQSKHMLFECPLKGDIQIKSL